MIMWGEIKYRVIIPDLLLSKRTIPERLSCDVRPCGFVSICGFAQRWTVQFGTVPIPAGLGLFIREVSYCGQSGEGRAAISKSALLTIEDQLFFLVNLINVTLLCNFVANSFDFSYFIPFHICNLVL